jgi:hypothetical protein
VSRDGFREDASERNKKKTEEYVMKGQMSLRGHTEMSSLTESKIASNRKRQQKCKILFNVYEK